MLKKGVFAKYSYVEMLLRALPKDLWMTAVIQQKLDPRDPWIFKYHQRGTLVTEHYVSTYDLTLKDF